MSTIKCRTCHSSMVIDRCESSESAVTCWHQCPICKQVRLTSEHESSNRKTADLPDDDIVILGDHDSWNEPGYIL